MESGKIYIPKDPYRDLNISCLMGWRLGTVAKPFLEFSKRPVFTHPTNKIFGDQEIINETMSGNFRDINQLLSCASYKKDNPKQKSVDCVYFHGKPKPWDIGWTKFI